MLPATSKESDNETTNAILTRLKRNTGSHLSLNACRVTMLSASAWRILSIFYTIIEKAISTIFCILCSNVIDIWTTFLGWQRFWVCNSYIKGQNACISNSSPVPFGACGQTQLCVSTFLAAWSCHYSSNPAQEPLIQRMFLIPSRQVTSGFILHLVVPHPEHTASLNGVLEAGVGAVSLALLGKQWFPSCM